MSFQFDDMVDFLKIFHPYNDFIFFFDDYSRFLVKTVCSIGTLSVNRILVVAQIHMQSSQICQE